MIFLIIFILVFILIVDFLKKNFKYQSIKHPLALPILGNLLELGTSPHKALIRLSKKYGRIYSMYFGDVYTVVVSDVDLMREIFVKNFDNFLERPKLPSIEGPSLGWKNLVVGNEYYWKRAKKRVANTFHKTKLSQHAYDMINQEVGSFIEAFKESSKTGEPIKPRKLVQRYTVNVILRYVFNTYISYNFSDKKEVIGNEKNLIELINTIDDFMKMVASGNICDFLTITQPIYKYYTRYFGCHHKIVALIRDIYKQHEKTIDYENPRDLIDSMIIDTKNEKSPDPDDELLNIHIGFDFFVAGSDTSSNTIEWFILLMANHQEYQEKCYTELKSLGTGQIKLNDRASTPFFNATVKEVMRLHPVGPLSLPRSNRDDFTLSNGMFIPAQSQIIMNLGSLLSDEGYFKSANEFLPTRFLDEPNNPNFLPFGLGPRSCVGSQLALDEIFISCSNLLLNYKIKTVDGKLIPEDEKFALTIHPLIDFSVIVEKRN